MSEVKDAIVGLVMDRSGSMISMWEEAVGGYNAFVQEQLENGGRTWFTLTYFDHDIYHKYDAIDINEVEKLEVGDSEIYPRGMTALIDATIRTIRNIEKWLSNSKSWFDGKIFIVVITDGAENASEASSSALKEIVKSKSDLGWEFIYLAANVDLEETSKKYGFNIETASSYDAATVGQTYGATSKNITTSRLEKS